MSDVSMLGRVAIVTGAGGGLGRAYARELARAGASVVVNDTGGSLNGAGASISAAQAVVDEIVKAGGQAVANTASVASPEGGEAIVQTALDTFGRLDAVVNNAGILRDRTFAKVDWDDFHLVHDVHLRGAAYVSKPAFGVMKEQGFGRFVFVSSNAGTFGNFGQSAYGSAKAGIIGLSNVIALEGERAGILSNVVCPMARTRMTESMMSEASELGPEHVAPLVVYLASEACEHTHQVISAGGGKFSRVFTGLSEGWTAERGHVATADEVAQHMEQILDTAFFSVPMSATEEVAGLGDRLA
jgi:NAD(P)-dependent dehydrogenase (short-subunit alcohol dehydrogenase family)